MNNWFDNESLFIFKRNGIWRPKIWTVIVFLLSNFHCITEEITLNFYKAKKYKGFRVKAKLEKNKEIRIYAHLKNRNIF